MRRLFGQQKEKTPVPTLSQTVEKLDSRGATIDEKIKALDAKLLELKAQIAKARGPTQQRLKQRALGLLKQKRMYEGQRDQLSQQSFNLEQVAFTQETVKSTFDTVAAMKDASKSLKADYKKINLNDVENLQDEMEDLLDYSNEISEVLGRSYATPDDIDEADLEDELNALEAEMDLDGIGEEKGEPLYMPEVPTNSTDSFAASHSTVPEAVATAI